MAGVKINVLDNPTKVLVVKPNDLFPTPFLPENGQRRNVGFQFLVEAAKGTICWVLAYALRDIETGEALYR